MLRRLFILAAGIVALAACANTDTSRAQAAQTLQASYALLTVAAAAYSAQVPCMDGAPPPPLCASASVTAEIVRAKAVADVAMQGVLQRLASPIGGTTSELMQDGLLVISVYAKVLATYGIKT